VLTHNYYFGADLQPIFQATSFPDLLTRVAQAFAMVQATNFSERAKAFADEIAATAPHVVGLQEVALWRTGTPVDLAHWTPGTPAETVAYDFLAILLDELAARGQAYAVVAKVENVDAQAPGFTAAGLVQDIRLTDHDVIIARTDLPGKVFKVGGAASGHFTARVSSSLFGMPIDTKSGWNRVDVSVHGRPVRIVETHLEPFDLAVQEARGPNWSTVPWLPRRRPYSWGTLIHPRPEGTPTKRCSARGLRMSGPPRDPTMPASPGARPRTCAIPNQR
jgi:hypothetical protein